MKKSYSFSSIASEKSCCCKSSNKNNCCKSQKVVVKKIKDNYLASAFHFKAPQLNFIVCQYSNFIKDAIVLTNETKLFKDFSPPEPRLSLSILYRSILI